MAGTTRGETASGLFTYKLYCRVYIRFFSGRNISKYFEYLEIFQLFLNSRETFVYADLFCSSKEEIFYIWKCGNIYDSKVLICCHFQFCTYILFMIININKYMNNNKIEKLSK